MLVAVVRCTSLAAQHTVPLHRLLPWWLERIRVEVRYESIGKTCGCALEYADRTPASMYGKRDGAGVGATDWY